MELLDLNKGQRAQVMAVIKDLIASTPDLMKKHNVTFEPEYVLAHLLMELSKHYATEYPTIHKFIHKKAEDISNLI